MIKKPFLAKLLNRLFHSFQSNFLNDNHARISNEDAAVFDPFLEVLLKADNVIEKQGEKSAVAKISQYMTQVSSLPSLQGIEFCKFPYKP